MTNKSGAGGAARPIPLESIDQKLLLETVRTKLAASSRKESTQVQYNRAASDMLGWCASTNTDITSDLGWAYLTATRILPGVSPTIGQLLYEAALELKQAPAKVEAKPIDCTPSSAPSDDLVKLLAEQTTLLRIERESTSKLQSENADLRAKNERLTIAMKHSDQLIDACLRVMEKEKVIASPAYQDERNEIRRVLVAMNRWTVNNK